MVEIKNFYDPHTATMSYVVHDMSTNNAAVIDAVLDYDQFSGRLSTSSVDVVINYLQQHHMKLSWILETHIHADHITAAHYIKQRLGGSIAIGSRIQDVLPYWLKFFALDDDKANYITQFDRLLDDNETIALGASTIRVLHTPGHTPVCVSYLVDDAIFVGDALFMPDVGCGRTDFPGGSAEKLFVSIKKIYDLSPETQIYTGHDYPTKDRLASCVSLVREQKHSNIMLNETITREEFVKCRNDRDLNKPVPKLLYPALQLNLRAGSVGRKEDQLQQFVKIPLTWA